MELTLVKQSHEQSLDPLALRMLGVKANEEVEGCAMQGLIQDYRFRRQTVCSAQLVAATRAPHRPVDMAESSGVNEVCQLGNEGKASTDVPFHPSPEESACIFGPLYEGLR